MAIVLELQEEALKSDADILSLLRKSSLIARKLDLKDFQEWIYSELNGYKNTDNLPDYRYIRGDLKALNPVHGWVPVVISGEEEKRFSIRKIYDSIPSINSLLVSNDKQLNLSLSGKEIDLLNKYIPFKTTYIILISPNSVSNIIEQVKNRILDWSITLEEYRILGDNLSFTTDEKEKAKNEPQIVNYISNFYGPVTDTQFQQGTTNSKQKLKKTLPKQAK
ncbi:AbiTii domain-containing protein [Anaeromicropila populeti]|uniref:AbiTii domain-containing protein n=1 Tax=Anaeromicropila populeti TaxID=37658 RepID=A0A1I6IWU2_9FIRM|nr:hypothetical protein [Anaeromicropila populeti]SFR71212.1 hypothetical protein SAMN05661086_01201 [Anaeromicropila populeti]